MRGSTILWCLCFLLIRPLQAFALNPSLDIDQYAHSAWTIRDGFLTSRVLSIAQTGDGYLWLGTENGVFRFDGIKTTRWQPVGQERFLDKSISRLLVTRDGALWIGTVDGLARWKDGRFRTYPALAGQTVLALTEDSQGTLWAGSLGIPTGRLCAIRDELKCSGEDEQFGTGVFSVFDDRGTLWVGATTGLWRWAPGEPALYPPLPASISQVTRIGTGPLLIATNGGIHQLVGHAFVPYRLNGFDRPLDAKTLLIDRDGGTWIATARQGLVHLHRGHVDVFTRADGLSGDSITGLYEDHEGNIWVSTNEGLDRFRERAIATLATRQGLATDSSFSVLPARDGSVWIASGNGLTRSKDGQTTIYRTPDGLPDNRIGTLFEDGRGRIIAATLHGLAAFNGENFTRLLKHDPTRIVYNIIEAPAGVLWINDQEQGLLRVVGQEVVQQISWAALRHEDHANAFVRDSTRDGFWLGFYNGGVAFLKNGAPSATYGTADGLGAGRVSHLRFDEDGTLWASTVAGLSRITDNHIATLTTRNGLPCEGVQWSLADLDHALWMLMPCGLVQISARELSAWVADPKRSVAMTVFDSSDGVSTQFSPIAFAPTAATLADGRLAFATPSGLGLVDPRHLPLNPVAPPVQVERLVANHQTFELPPAGDQPVRLPAQIRDLQIDYTALSLAAPDRVRFRYKLEGFDQNWQEVGTRRQAFYTTLPPGKYRFRVTAANNNAVWTETGASVAFIVAPAYYQTYWFMALSAGLMAALVWGAHRIRLRIVETHEREISALNERLMKAQEQERIRIAGELHDGVMQQMLAVTMMLGSAKRRITGNPDVTATIDRVQDKLIRAGNDIRQMSHNLHPPILQEDGLPKAVQGYCEEFSSTCGIPVSCEADERVRDLSRGAGLALFRIVQEALGNASKHAKATRIAVRLHRSANSVSLAVSDNGVGFDTGRLAGPRGLGLVMMRERASQLNGTFDLESATGRGTTITVVIPFR
jgi:signal transduction histidine kinase/ligand-binding sensor domain-containing protein